PPVQFRCHVGHSYEAETLLAEQAANLEAALWTAVRTFREKCVLSRQLATRDRKGGNSESAERFEEQARLAEHYALLIQQFILHGDRPPAPAQPIPTIQAPPSAEEAGARRD